MEDVLFNLVMAFGLVWLALMIYGLVMGLYRGTATAPDWWDLEEQEQQAAIEQARKDYTDSLRQANPQPVRDGLLRAAGRFEPRAAA